MRSQSWTASSRRLALLFFAVALPPAVTLVWLGLQLLNEDQALLTQRQIERRQGDADAIVRSLNQSLIEAEAALNDPHVPAGMVRFVIRAEAIRAEPADRVVWMPQVSRPPVDDSGRFAAAERMEYQGSADRALVMYEDAARATAPAVRAGGLFRIARVQRSRKNWNGAAAAYRRLAMIPDVVVAGAPADLQARRALCAVLAETQQAAELEREAKRLETDLVAGKWSLDRAAWQLTADDVAGWSGHPVNVSDERRLFSNIADALWRERPTTRQGRRLMTTPDYSATALWRHMDGQEIVLVIGPSVLDGWVKRANGQVHEPGVRLSLLQANGGVVIGDRPTEASAPSIKAPASETGLPWTVVMTVTGASSVGADLASRRRMLATGLASILLLFIGGSYFLWRAMRRELDVARLQTDFVATVSHEFRTPLASLRHITELLQETDDVPRERRRTFYDALGRNTERLHRLVESLLDFSRMESGRKPYNLRPLDVGAFTTEIVAEFQKDAATRGFTVDLVVQPGPPPQVLADRASLSNALWNLLDNAVKYSDGNRSVDVSVQPVPGGVTIAVRDHGLGIPPHERTEIFRRFVRGEKASQLGIKGTGLGLAMVSHIVDAHGGRIELDSEEGVGSTFRIVLPAAS